MSIALAALPVVDSQVAEKVGPVADSVFEDSINLVPSPVASDQ